METYISMPPIFGLFGLLIALIIYFIVVSYDEGSEKVKKIADQIHLGAMVFMRREYTYLFFFVLVLIALSYFALGFNTALAVTAGALSSSLAGWLGMFSATKANSRTATAAAEKGSKVILVDLNRDSSEKVAEEINNKFSNSAYSFKADLTKPEEIEDMLKFGISKFSKIDCICNNAASSQGIGPVESYSLEDVQTTLDLTFTCLWKCLQAEIKFLKQQR